MPAELPEQRMAWEDEGLVLEGTRYTLRLEPWPSPSAALRTPHSGWIRGDALAERLFRLYPDERFEERPLWDPMGLVSGYRRELAADGDAEALFWPASYYFDRIPEPRRRIIGGHRLGRWGMLRFLALDERALDLALSNPGLAFALSRHLREEEGFRPDGDERAHDILGLGQRELLAMAGFPATEPVRRILSKIDRWSLSAPLIRVLMLALREDAIVSRLAALPRIDHDALTIALDPILRALVDDRLLLEIATTKAADRISLEGRELMKSLRRAALYVNEAGQERRFLPFVSLSQVSRLRRRFEEASLEKARRAALSGPDRKFPAPPFPGTESIRPILSSHELIMEAREMENCVSSYQGEVEGGIAYFYRVERPERATMAIMNQGLFGRSRWVPTSMLGSKNRELPGRIVEAAYLELFDSALSGGD